MNEELRKIFDDAKTRIGAALEPDLKGEYDMNDIYVLVKDLAHVGGTKSAPMSIMKVGTLFYKKIGSGYYSDGFHLIASHVANGNPEYFQKM